MGWPEICETIIAAQNRCIKYLPCLDGLALFTLEPIRFDLRPLHSDTYGSSGGDLVLCFLRGVHSLNNWLCPEVLSRASGLQNKSLFLLLPNTGFVLTRRSSAVGTSSIRAEVIQQPLCMLAMHACNETRISQDACMLSTLDGMGFVTDMQHAYARTKHYTLSSIC